MAVQVQEPMRSSPDIGKLNAMTSRIVSVTRHTTKTGPGFLVLPPWKGASVDDIIKLLSTLPSQYGPGTYKFEVWDEGGPERDTWTAKLGADVPDTVSTSPALAGSTPLDPSAMASNPIGSMTQDLGGGFHYVPSLGLLITPQKQAIPWTPNQGLPAPGATAPVSAAPASPFAGFGLGGLAGLNIPGLTSPVASVDDAKIRALEESLRNEREARAEEARRREASETRASFEKMIEQTNTRFEGLVKSLTEKQPSGPSASEQQLQRELEEMRRRLDEERRTAEMRTREDTMRAEMRAQQERTEAMMREMREASRDRQDPMVPLITSLLTTQQSSSSEAIRAMSEASKANLEASKSAASLVVDRLSGSTMTPERTMEMMRAIASTTQGANGEINKGLVDMFQTLFGMQKEMIQVQMQANSEASGPVWLPIAQQATEQIGRLAQVYAVSKGREQAQQQQQAQQRALQQQRQQQQLQQQRQQQQQQRGEDGDDDEDEAEAAPDPDSPAAIRDAAAKQVFKEAPSVQARNQVAAQLEITRPPVAPEEPSNGRKRRSKRAVVSKEQLAQVVAQMSDADFFGEALNEVNVLRESAATMAPADVVAAIFQARQYFLASGAIPPAIELLQAGHVDLLVGRLFPSAPPAFQQAVMHALLAQLRMESAPEAASPVADA